MGAGSSGTMALLERDGESQLIDVLAGRAQVLRPAPLSPAAAAVVVRVRLPDAVEAFTAACHAATGGNAFLLGELLAELTDQGMRGTAQEATRVLEFGSARQRFRPRCPPLRVRRPKRPPAATPA